MIIILTILMVIFRILSNILFSNFSINLRAVVFQFSDFVITILLQLLQFNMVNDDAIDTF